MPKIDIAEVHEVLMAILRIAGSVCFKIHTQINGFECEGNRDLPTTFSLDSRIMEAHSLHYRLLSDDPTAMDGKRILLVTRPAILAIGKADVQGVRVGRKDLNESERMSQRSWLYTNIQYSLLFTTSDIVEVRWLLSVGSIAVQIAERSSFSLDPFYVDDRIRDIYVSYNVPS